MGKTAYGEFTFSKPKERMSIPGYAHGGAACAPTPMKKGGKAKPESKAMVSKEVALLRKTGAPTKMIKHEETEMPEAMPMAASMSPLASAARPPMAASGMMKKGGMAAFEKSGKDVEKKGIKEGSKADMALDKKQMMGMKKGGMVEGGKADMAQDKAMIKKAFKQHDSQEHPGGKGTTLKLKKGGVPSFNRSPKVC